MARHVGDGRPVDDGGQRDGGDGQKNNGKEGQQDDRWHDDGIGRHDDGIGKQG